jgi:hypothetical protein
MPDQLTTLHPTTTATPAEQVRTSPRRFARRPGTRALAALGLVCALLTGCASSTTAATTSPDRWVPRFCLVSPSAHASTVFQGIDPSAAQAGAAIATRVTGLTADFEKAAREVNAIGSPAVPFGRTYARERLRDLGAALHRLQVDPLLRPDRFRKLSGDDLALAANEFQIAVGHERNSRQAAIALEHLAPYFERTPACRPLRLNLDADR